MRIQRLTLENFRGARGLSIDLDRQLNVFVGANGAGKSTVLDAAAILLSWFVNRIDNPRASGRPITETDISNDRPAARLDMEFSLMTGRRFTWGVAKTRRPRSRNPASLLKGATDAANQVKEELDSQCKSSLPLVAYYPVNRAVLDIPLRIRSRHRFDMMDANEGSLTGGANFRTFFEWFREREDLENENRRYAGSMSPPEGCQFPDPQLKAVRRALRQLTLGFKNPTVRRNPLRMEVEKGGRTLLVNQLSDGEKCLMAMVGDLARRLAIANPKRGNPLGGSGIVLIDELDLHLHPKWQRELMTRLQQVFTRCQFLVSTHSPHVMTHVQPESLFLLNAKPGGLSLIRPQESYGKTADSLLEGLMGLKTTRPTEVSESLEEIYDLIQAGSLKRASQRIEALQEKVGADPDLVRATVLIKRKEYLGK